MNFVFTFLDAIFLLKKYLNFDICFLPKPFEGHILGENVVDVENLVINQT